MTLEARVETRMGVADGEEFDEAFLHELDAVEAAALQHSRAPAGSSTSYNEIEQRAEAGTPSDSSMLEQSCSDGRSLKTTRHDEASSNVDVYRWAVGDISVQDDAAMDASASDRIGQVTAELPRRLQSCAFWMQSTRR